MGADGETKIDGDVEPVLVVLSADERRVLTLSCRSGVRVGAAPPSSGLLLRRR
jgi:hypothetical protein